MFHNLLTNLYPYLPMLFVLGLMFAAAKVVSILRQTDDSTMEKQGTSPITIVLMAVLFLALLLLANGMTGGRVMALLGVIVRNPMALPLVGMFAVKRLHSSDNGLQTVIFVGSEEECHSVAKDYAEDVSRRFDTPVQTICGDTYGVSVKNSSPFTITYHVNEITQEEALHFASLAIGDELALTTNYNAYDDHFDYIIIYCQNWNSHNDRQVKYILDKYGLNYTSTYTHITERQKGSFSNTPRLMVQVLVEKAQQ